MEVDNYMYVEKSRRKAFTLVEMLVTVTTMGFIMVLSFAILSKTMNISASTGDVYNSEYNVLGTVVKMRESVASADVVKVYFNGIEIFEGGQSTPAHTYVVDGSLLVQNGVPVLRIDPSQTFIVNDSGRVNILLSAEITNRDFKETYKQYDVVVKPRVGSVLDGTGQLTVGSGV